MQCLLPRPSFCAWPRPLHEQRVGWVDDEEHGSIWPDCVSPLRTVTVGRTEQQGSLSEKIVVFQKPQPKAVSSQRKQTLARHDFNLEVENPQHVIRHIKEDSFLTARDWVFSRRSFLGAANVGVSGCLNHLWDFKCEHRSVDTLDVKVLGPWVSTDINILSLTQ